MRNVSAEEVKQQIPIELLLNRLNIEQNRANFVVCPFHGDSDPSLKIYPNSDSFYCFGCGAGGSVIDFYMNWAGIEFFGAVQALGEMFGLSSKKLTRSTKADIYEQKFKSQQNKQEKESENYWFRKWQKCKEILKQDHKELNDELVWACQNIAYAEYRMDLEMGNIDE